MVDDLEERLSRYRADLDAAVAADLADRRPASHLAEFAAPTRFLLDVDHRIRPEPTVSTAIRPPRVVAHRQLGVAAAVAALVLVGARGDRRRDDATPADQPSPTVTVPPTDASASAVRHVRRSSSRPGRTSSTRSTEHRRRGSSSPSAPGGRTDVGSTASGVARSGALEDDVGFITFSRPDRVFSDACHLERWVSPGARDDPRRPRRRAQRAAGMGRRDRPVGHLRRRLRRQNVPTHRARRALGLPQHGAWAHGSRA